MGGERRVKEKRPWRLGLLAALVWLVLRGPEALLDLLRWAVGAAAPFLWGGALAFLLHVPLRAIERRLPERWQKGRRPAALALTGCSVLALFLWVVGLVLPQLADTALSLRQSLPQAWAGICAGVQSLCTRWPLAAQLLGERGLPQWTEVVPRLLESLPRRDLMHSTVHAARGLASGMVDFFVGVVFAFYLLAQKEKLAAQCRMLLWAFWPRRAGQLEEVAVLAEKTFSAFLSGQCLEACILGAMFAVGMLLCRMPYVTLISVVIALTALIPVFGTVAGCLIGTGLIAVQSPMQAVWFVVLFLCLQQIEGTFIYPRVVGNSVGLPPIWVLSAVTLGGNLFGVAGILFMIPLASVAYALLRRAVHRRLDRCGGDHQKYKPGSGPTA